VRPVDIEKLLGDDRVKKITDKGEIEIGIEIEIEDPKDKLPELLVSSGGTGEVDDPVIVSLSGNPVTITVVNADDYDDIEWFYGTISLETGDTFVVDVANTPFDEEGTYQLAVEGTADGVSYSTEIFIKVES
jgi:hypothetical protein